VLSEQIKVAHTVPAGVLREDLVRELDEFRRQLHDPTIERAMRIILERASVDPAYRELKEALYQEGSRVYVEIIRDAVARGELDPRIDPRQAVDELAGPLAYGRLFAGRILTTDYVRHIVDNFVAANATTRV
jgi:hypothetical protein